MAGIGHRSSPLLSPGRRLILLPSLTYAHTLKPIPGFAGPTDRGSPEAAIGLGSPSGALSSDDILALPFGAAAYLDTKALVTLAATMGDDPDRPAAAALSDATLFLEGRSLGPVRLRPGSKAAGDKEPPSGREAPRNSSSKTELLLEAKRLLPWYDGLPYSLRDPKGREYRVVGCRPATPRRWKGQVTNDLLEHPPTSSQTVDVQGVMFPTPDFERLAGKAIKAARREGGVPRGRVYKALESLPNPIRGPFVQLLVESGRLRDLGELLVVDPPEEALSPMSRGVLQELRDAGSLGVPLTDRPGAFRDAAILLESLDLAVVLGGRLAWADTGFSDLLEDLRRRFSPGISADDVAEFLGASKSLAKDLLRRLADEGALDSLSATEARWLREGPR